MAAVDATIVFLPRFTTLAGEEEFTTAPLDVSRFEGAQFEVWRGPIRGGTGTFKVYLEESLDAQTWVLGPSTPAGYEVAQGESKFFSYSFRLRWFRVRVALTGSNSVVTCWAEGLLRGGGGGLWTLPATSAGAAGGLLAGAGIVTPPAPTPAGFGSLQPFRGPAAPGASPFQPAGGAGGGP